MVRRVNLRENLAATLDHCVASRLGLPRVDWDRLFSMLSDAARQSPHTLPLWLNEGFATVMEKTLFGRGFALATADTQEHRDYWDESTIQGFWSGAAFRDPRGQRLSYQLAEMLMRMLAKDYTKLTRLALTARAADAGEAAFQHSHGRGLETLLFGLLGEGPWQSVPWRW